LFDIEKSNYNIWNGKYKILKEVKSRLLGWVGHVGCIGKGKGDPIQAVKAQGRIGV
jgi:hypothetical protein